VEVFFKQCRRDTSILNCKGDVKIVDTVGGFADLPVKVMELEAMLEAFECFNAFRCTGPIPNTDSIIDVTCPVEEVSAVANMLIAPVPRSRAYHIGSHPRPVTYFIDQADLPNDIMCIRQSCMCISHCVWDPVGPPVGPHFCSDVNSKPSQAFAIHFS